MFFFKAFALYILMLWYLIYSHSGHIIFIDFIFITYRTILFMTYDNFPWTWLFWYRYCHTFYGTTWYIFCFPLTFHLQLYFCLKLLLVSGIVYFYTITIFCLKKESLILYVCAYSKVIIQSFCFVLKLIWHLFFLVLKVVCTMLPVNKTTSQHSGILYNLTNKQELLS